MDELKSDILSAPLDNVGDDRPLIFGGQTGWQKIILSEPDIDKKRGILGFKVIHNSRLKAVHLEDVRTKTGTHEGPFEMYMTDEIRREVGEKGYGIVRKLLEEDMRSILLDPYGERSLDPDKNERTAQRLRTINAAISELEQLIGRPLCIKGTGRDTYLQDPDRENLIFQFDVMRELALRNPHITEQTQKELGFSPIRFADVYAAIQYPIHKDPEKWADPHDVQQFLIMERVPNAKRVFEVGKRYAVATLGWGGNNSGVETVYGFDSTGHPRLAAFCHARSRDEFVMFDEVQRQLRILGISNASDVAARNVIYSDAPPNQRNYVIIDQRPRVNFFKVKI